MPPPARRPLPPGTDPQLRPFLEAATDADAALALARLMDAIAPVLDARLGRRCAGGRNGSDAEDVTSEARAQLAIHLQNLRAAPTARAPIADLRAYAATVANSAWAANLRQRHPARAALHNRLRYLLDNRTRDRGFARWDTPGGESLAGFTAWRGTLPDPSNARHQQLRAEPRAALASAFGAGSHRGALAEQVAGLLTWLGGPLPLRELIDALSELSQADAAHPAPPADPASGADPSPGDSAGLAIADPLPSPHDALRWKEYLRWLWQETARLTLRQRRAFLLHSPCLREMELLGLTGVRQAAALLEVPSERMAEYWNALPVEDRVIAALLGVEGQQVINLRKAARASLFRAWNQWSGEK